MPTQLQFTQIAIAAYLAVLGYIPYHSSRKETPSDYVIANRNVGTLATTASVASGFRDGAGIAAGVQCG